MEIKSLEPFLKEHPFFKGLDEDFIVMMTGCAKNVRFQQGKMIFRESEKADQFYIIHNGRVAVEVFGVQHGSFTIQTIEAGSILGWSWLVPPYRWNFDARAVEDTQAIALDAVCLRKKCSKDTALGYELLKRITGVFGERLQATRLQLLDLYGVKQAITEVVGRKRGR